MHSVRFFLPALILLAITLTSLQAQYSGGSGTPEDPYQIGTPTDLIALGANTGDYNKHFILTADIDLNGRTFIKALISPDNDNISSSFQGTQFTGIFNGNNHYIKNLMINQADNDYLGLFGYMGPGCQIQNLGMDNVSIHGRNYIGGLCGMEYQGLINNCHISGSVSGKSNVGGLMGLAKSDGINRPINNCYAIAEVSGTGDYIGGLFGSVEDTWVFNCYTNSVVTGNGKYTGGLCGYSSRSNIGYCHTNGTSSGGSEAGGLCGSNWGQIYECYTDGPTNGTNSVGGLCGSNNGSITQCFANGPVVGAYYIGGLCGYNIDSFTKIITQCYSTGAVTGIDYIGGLCGKNGSTIDRCYAIGKVKASGTYAGGLCGLNSDINGLNEHIIVDSVWDIETSGLAFSAGGLGLTTTQMKQMLSYSVNAWSDTSWTISEGDYPRLTWELVGGTNISDPEVTLQGDGTIDNPWLITSVTDFLQMSSGSYYWDKHYRLTANLDLSGIVLNRIGYDKNNAFKGSFDGNGHTLSNLQINTPSTNLVGFFCYLNSTAKITKLGLLNVKIAGFNKVGGICGLNYGIISQCYTTGSISGNKSVGGICGNNYNKIYLSISSSSVTGVESVGGLCGDSVGMGYPKISQCYATGLVAGANKVGGLCGNNSGTDSHITHCYATGLTQGTGDEVGGLLGYSFGKVEGCFWDMQTTGQTTSAGNTGVIGKNRDQMLDAELFLAAGWDYSDDDGDPADWIAYSNSYPVLAWESVESAVVPNTIALNEAQAITLLQEARLDIRIINKYSKTYPTGQVIAQDLPPDLIVRTGTPVVLQISLGIKYSGGNGTLDDPFELSTPGDLESLGQNTDDYDRYFIITNDIDLLGISFSHAVVAFDTDPSNTLFQGADFNGVLDGNGHIISNLTIDASDTDHLGLIGKIGNNGQIIKLGLYNFTINGDDVGVGGLCGFNYGLVDRCYAIGSTSGDGAVGNLCGSNGGTINQSYTIGNVIGNNRIGGLCGYNDGIINQCYSACKVTGNTNVEGFCGFNTNSITACFWDMGMTGQNEAMNGWGLSTAQMQEMLYYSANGWDATWTLPEGSYPRLAWEQAGGPFITEPDVTMTGNGTVEAPWLIASEEDLKQITTGLFFWDKHYRLMSDLDMSEFHLNHIGMNRANPFTGSFDGDGHIISNLTLVKTEIDYLGFIGILGTGGQILNLGLNNIEISGRDYVGGLCGINYGIISSCYVAGAVDGNSYIGGLCGTNNTGNINQCYTNVSVAGNSKVAGFCGENSRGTLENCYVMGPSSSRWNSPNGFCAFSSGTINGCFWDIETTGLSNSGGGIGKLRREMLDANTYLTAGWDFSDEDGDPADWILYPNSYPALAWESVNLIAVPNVVGLDHSIAVTRLQSAKLDIRTVGYYNKSIPAGQIVAQDIAPDQIIRTDQPIVLTVSLGLKYSGGNGTAEEPFEIATSDDLLAIGTFGDYDKQFILTADIDLSKAGPNGNGTFANAILGGDSAFTGVLDGNHFIICNFSVIFTSQPTLGFCRVVGVKGQIRNLGIANAIVEGVDYVGLLCGSNLGTISNCFVTGKVIGHISDYPHYPGGLCGYNTGSIQNCYASVSVSNNHSSGGFCGENSGTIQQSYSVGPVRKYAGPQGFCAYNYSGTITNCFWDIDTSGHTESAGGTGLTTAQMKSLQPYLDAGWDFTDADGDPADWNFYEGFYPILAWMPMVNIPDVTGLTEEETLSFLKNNRLIGIITREISATVPVGYAVNTFPSPGSILPAGSTIQLVISLGPPCPGDGTAGNPYQIHSVNQWIWLTQTPTVWDKHFILMADLDFDGLDIQPVGIFHFRTEMIPFSGVFDGNGHVIRNWKFHYQTDQYSGSGENGVGFFAFVDGGKIRNLGLQDFEITFDTNRHVDAGGLVGRISAGIEPYNNGCLIENCYVAGILSGRINSYGTLGGLAGSNRYGQIRNCYSDCQLSNETIQSGFYMGSLVALSVYPTSAITACFWNQEKMATGIDRTSGMYPELIQAEGLSTDLMQLPILFLNQGWDFIGETQNGTQDIWHMPWNHSGGPMLWNQKDIPGDVAGGYGVDLADFGRLSYDWLGDDGAYTLGGTWPADGVTDTVELAMLADHWLAQPALDASGLLAAHWSFDTDGQDSQGAHPGQLENGAAITVDPAEVKLGGGALTLDGVDDVVNCGTGDGIATLSTFSVAMWFKADAITGNTMQLMGQRDQSSQMWGLSIWGSQAGHLTGYVDAAGAGATTESAFTPTVGRWTHVVMTYDDLGDRKVRLYVDGVETPYSQQNPATGAKRVDATIPITIGDRFGGGRAFGGVIDEVHIYRRILTATDILVLAGADQPVAFWTLDTDGTDSQGVHPATLLNGAAITTAPAEVKQGGGALTLDGVDDVVNCGTGDGIAILPTFSVALWFKADAVTGNTMQLMGQRDQSSQMWGLSIWGSQAGHLTGYVGAAGVGATTEAAFTPTAGRWTHAVMTYDDLGDRKVRLYVDGVETGTVGQTAAVGTKLFNAAIPVTIGDRAGGGRAFGGGVDEVRIYRRVLTAGEIAALAGGA